MGLKRTDEFRLDALRIALTSGLTVARQSKRCFDDRGASSSLTIHCLTGYCAAMSREGGC
ncbi:hypothetical protein [uncultured Sulfitobacter sp.]|jgi:hypothetical protein|uniref:hypothetical protein n=1 Tax=uncultured Sulfitobacter sp. TaxID=191468 RepID=UPI0030FAF793